MRCLQLRRGLVGAPDNAATMEWPRPCAGNLPSLDPDVLLMWKIVVVSDLVRSHLQVVGAVAFQNRRLSIPKDTNPELAALVESCWDE